VKRLNSRPSSSQHKRNESKWSQNDESSQERVKNELAKNTKNMTHKTNPGGHEVVRATIPAPNLEFLHKSLILWTSLTRTPKEKGKT
jgi:hypothetical protein